MTTYTRAQVETVLVSRTGKWLTLVGKATTIVGTNADLNDAIGTAVRLLEGTVANPSLVADADIQTVDSDSYDALLDISELRVLYSIRGNLTVVDVVSGPFEETFSDIGDYIDDQIKALEDRIENLYGLGGPEMLAGVITRDIASHNESIA